MLDCHLTLDHLITPSPNHQLFQEAFEVCCCGVWGVELGEGWGDEDEAVDHGVKVGRWEGMGGVIRSHDHHT
jgi:hypothetical protein